MQLSNRDPDWDLDPGIFNGISYCGNFLRSAVLAEFAVAEYIDPVS